MLKLRSMFLTLAFLIAIVPRASALDPELIAASLPERFDGIYIWVGEDGRQDITVTINRTTVDAARQVLAFGDGQYIYDGQTLHFSMVWQIEPKSMRVEIWETSPRSDVEFVNDGSHIGVISEDLSTVSAVWTTASNGQQGTLVMREAE